MVARATETIVVSKKARKSPMKTDVRTSTRLHPSSCMDCDGLAGVDGFETGSLVSD